MTERNTTHIKPKRKVSFWEITMTAPLLGLLLRIPLANIIGNEGNGYMALGWEIYFVFYSILCYGVKDAIRKMVVKRVKKSYYHNSRRVLIFGTLFSLFLGLVSGGVMYLLAIPIFHHFLQLKAGSIVFKILSLFIVVNSLTFGYQGFFEGSGSKIPTCFSKIIYTLIGGTGAIIFAIILSKYGAKVSALLFERQYTPGFGAAGIISGYLCGAIASVLFLFVIFQIYGRHFHTLLRKDSTKVFESFGSILKEFSKTFILASLPLLWLHIYHAVNYILYMKHTAAENRFIKLSNLGSYYGKVLLLILLISVVITGFTTAGIKKIKRASENGRLKRVHFFIREDIKRILLFGSISSAVFMAFPQYILGLFFRNVSRYEENLLRYGAVNLLLISLAVYLFFLLTSFNQNLQIFIIYACSFILQTITMVISVKTGLSDYSLVISEYVFWIFIILGENIILRKAVHK